MKSTHHYPGQLDAPAEKPALFGKLSILHLIFLVFSALFILLAAYIRSWEAVVVFLLFISAMIMLTAQFNLRRHNRLTEIWSELSRQAGLELVRGRSCLIGTPRPPSISGFYRNRQISISKIVKFAGDYEGSISTVFTRITLQVANTSKRRLEMRQKLLVFGLFSFSLFPKNATGNNNFDRHFECRGQPVDFIQNTARWISKNPALYERPAGVIMLTDSLLSFTNWGAPSIALEGDQLIYLHPGIVPDVREQVNILNLLCDMAELSEKIFLSKV